jgi:hypothetical protein
MAYGAVFTSSIDTLQNDEQGALPFSVEPVLQFVDSGAIFRTLMFCRLAVWEGGGVASV